MLWCLPAWPTLLWYFARHLSIAFYANCWAISHKVWFCVSSFFPTGYSGCRGWWVRMNGWSLLKVTNQHGALSFQLSAVHSACWSTLSPKGTVVLSSSHPYLTHQQQLLEMHTDTSTHRRHTDTSPNGVRCNGCEHVDEHSLVDSTSSNTSRSEVT